MFNSLERLSDKFNVLTYNIRELLFKLYVWNNTTKDVLNIKLRTEDSPHFEEFNIPSKSAIVNSMAIDYNNSKVINKKIINYIISEDINLSYLVDAKYQYITHTSNNSYKITLGNGNVGDIFEFVILMTNDINQAPISIYSIDQNNLIKTIFKTTTGNKKHKISAQRLLDEWVILDSYEIM